MHSLSLSHTEHNTPKLFAVRVTTMLRNICPKLNYSPSSSSWFVCVCALSLLWQTGANRKAYATQRSNKLLQWSYYDVIVINTLTKHCQANIVIIHWCRLVRQNCIFSCEQYIKWGNYVKEIRLLRFSFEANHVGMAVSWKGFRLHFRKRFALKAREAHETFQFIRSLSIRICVFLEKTAFFILSPLSGSRKTRYINHWQWQCVQSQFDF